MRAACVDRRIQPVRRLTNRTFGSTANTLTVTGLIARRDYTAGGTAGIACVSPQLPVEKYFGRRIYVSWSMRGSLSGPLNRYQQGCTLAQATPLQGVLSSQWSTFSWIAVITDYGLYSFDLGYLGSVAIGDWVEIDLATSTMLVIA